MPEDRLTPTHCCNMFQGCCAQQAVSTCTCRCRGCKYVYDYAATYIEKIRKDPLARVPYTPAPKNGHLFTSNLGEGFICQGCNLRAYFSASEAEWCVSLPNFYPEGGDPFLRDISCPGIPFNSRTLDPRRGITPPVYKPQTAASHIEARFAALDIPDTEDE